MPTTPAPDQRPDAWSAVAEAYDRFSQQVTLPFAEGAARLVHIGRGTRVLDVAAGTGNFAFAAARRGARVLATDAPPASPGPPPPWARLGDADALRARLLANGFAHAHVVELRHVWVFDDVEAFTRTMPEAAPPAVAMFASMTAAQRTAFVSAIEADFRARQGDGPYALTHEGMIAVATAP